MFGNARPALQKKCKIFIASGETEGVVVATGSHTFFGKTAALINKASNEVGHFQPLIDPPFDAIGFYREEARRLAAIPSQLG